MQILALQLKMSYMTKCTKKRGLETTLKQKNDYDARLPSATYPITD